MAPRIKFDNHLTKLKCLFIRKHQSKAARLFNISNRERRLSCKCATLNRIRILGKTELENPRGKDLLGHIWVGSWAVREMKLGECVGRRSRKRDQGRRTTGYP